MYTYVCRIAFLHDCIYNNMAYACNTVVYSLHTMYTHMLQDKCTALMFAAGAGHTDVVQLLMSRKDVDINMTDKVKVVISYCP